MDGAIAASVRRSPGPPARVRCQGPGIPDRAGELANTLTHGLGLVLSVAGLCSLTLIAGRSGARSHALACVVFGMSLVLVYTASTLYHGWRSAGTRKVLLLLDHIAIYVMIAGTYTPLALIPLRGSSGLGLLALAWGFALAGSVAKVIRIDRLDEESPLPYVVMSVMVTPALARLGATAPPAGLHALLAGGALYAIGLYFFVRDDGRFDHAIWHLFVLAGSIAHFRAVVAFVTFDAGTM